MKRFVGAAIAVSFAVSIAYAQEEQLYPFQSFLDWTENPQCDAVGQRIDPSGPCGNGSPGQYNFEEGMVGTARRAIQRYPEHYPPDLSDAEDVGEEAQVAYDSLLHNRPRIPYSQWGDVGHPAYMPDWNGDGTYGDSGGFALDGKGDFDYDTDGDPHAVAGPFLGTAPFRYPCPQADGRVLYELTTGGCAASGSFKLGTAREVRIVNARGLVLDATLWIPAETDRPGGGFPAVVFSNGLSSRQEHYYYFAMRLARAGYVVLTYDPAGQGESEGTWTDLFGFFDHPRACGELAGACRDIQDAVRWFVGDPVTSVVGQQDDRDGRFAPRRDPQTENLTNPVLGSVDLSRVAIAGNSMGAISILNYLDWYGDDGNGADSQPLPTVQAAISLSGATATKAVVPIQFQTSDYDGSPLLVGPTAFGVSLGQGDEGIGYKLIKGRYDSLRTAPGTTEAGPMSLVVLEGGVHTDHVAVPYVTRTTWANWLAGEYAVAWLDKYVKGQPQRWSDITSVPLGHLSRAFDSEQDPDGPAGVGVSTCIQKADRASLNQDPDDFAARYAGLPVDDAVSAPEIPCTP